MHLIVQTVLGGLIDYAGLFPPAALSMSQAVANYAGYLKGSHAWTLGRFVVPVARLDEFELAAQQYFPKSTPEPSWHLSTLGGEHADNDIGMISKFNNGHQGNAHVDAIELKVKKPSEIMNVMKAIPNKIETYFEIPVHNDPQEFIETIAQVNARAKVRTGGTTADAFPASRDLARFIQACIKANVAFKATAGLHHPIRSCYPLTYEKDSPQEMMYGFLNVFLTAAFVKKGIDLEKAVHLLEEQSIQRFQFEDDSVEWLGHTLTVDDIQSTRNNVAISFGSCSFEEPIADLHTAHLL